MLAEEWSWSQASKTLQVRPARRLETLESQPLMHGLMKRLSDGRIEYVSPDTTQLVTAFLNPGLTKRSASSITEPRIEERFARADRVLRVNGQYLSSQKQGTHLVLKAGPKESSQSIWSITLADGPIEWSDSGASLAGWGRGETPVLYHLQSGWSRLKSLKWDPGTEIVRFLSCDARRQILVENVLGAGITRLVFFRDGKPEAYTVFDFTGQARRSEATGAEAKSCNDLLVGGSFGLVRVTY
jgi:hypothetical protein